MKFPKLYKSTQIFKIALVIAIVVIGYIASVFCSKMKSLDASVELIATSNQTQLELEKLLSIISNYETSLRSYIITKDDVYLKDRFLSRGEIALNIKKLKLLTSDNPIVNKDLDSLQRMFDHRFKLFRETLTIAKSNNFDRNELNEALLKSTNFTNQMRAFVYKRINTESQKLKKLNDNHQFELEDSIVSAFLLVLLSLLILLLSFNKMRVDIHELKKTNDELKFLNHSFNNAEKIAGFGHWKYNLDTQKYTFSDNYYRLMGVEPQEFQSNLENAMNFIHPDDAEYVLKTHKQSLIDHQSTNIMLRYVLKSGEIRYIRSVGSFMRNSLGNLVKVGVNYDITEQYQKTLELEESNKHLKAINSELESFNNIVSHDLQEPMRKIQMFISRLHEKEAHVLSDQGKEYFSKINLAANRMQTLMIDLVNYTRTIKGDKVFVKTSLEKILDQVQADLSQNIEEKQAKITVKNLPVIQAIPFQMEQLFINLISNSLKYSKENVVPKISITGEKINGSDQYEDISISDKKCYKIVVSDNGIGFKQEYAERIFMLFQRLETDSKYTGTGLGLAICKKIIENHNGFIKAKSAPGEGTKFFIYLPKNS
ncbi:hypothetical protein FNO01nite_15750 [Flavobacterium noncentrifugens]|uniref:histidine kinase n=1 Tax=Flavobacterium noncentrifugens TaxID=1128970 RepID=A0A1G8WFT0_9FLAO|nr:ATP-binding protein [Flavobacterium noncentrifugens]GEP50903.1 hypothetical protein FNO01nite_15750 [Flavobacterium noncentrifugens]SDJ76937.1 hypothetical protein SAMN04487935_1794 [Flavobacterium noncentrifugens]